MSKVLAVTLARGGSKGVPDKHIRDLCGHPVLWYTLRAVIGCDLVDDYVVSSDDERILEIAAKEGVRTITRPASLAQDTTPTLPALRHAVTMMDVVVKYDYIVEVRATSPLKTSLDIDCATAMLTGNNADSVIGVTPLEDHHPMRAKWINPQGFIRDFIKEPESGRRQDLEPKAYVRNGTIYALTREAVMGAHSKLFGHDKSIAYIMPWERSINIDTMYDFMLCELLMKERG